MSLVTCSTGGAPNPAASLGLGVLIGLAAVLSASCSSVDPGPNYVVPNQVFNSDYFYCEVEPNVIFAVGCGDKQSGCHYSSSVPQMHLQQHNPVPCSGDKVTDPTQTASGTPANANFTVASFEMNRDYTTAPFYLRPTQSLDHPLQLFPADPNNQYVKIIATWAQK